MRNHAIYLAALLACAAVTSDATANARLIWNGSKWVASAIGGGVLYDSVKPDAADASPYREERRPPPVYAPAPGARPMTNVCVVPGLGSCALPHPIPAGTPCSCY